MKVIIKADDGTCFDIKGTSWDAIEEAIERCMGYEDNLLWERFISLVGSRAKDSFGTPITDLEDLEQINDVELLSEEEIKAFNVLNDRWGLYPVPNEVGHYVWNKSLDVWSDETGGWESV